MTDQRKVDEWLPIASAPDGLVVMTKIDDENGPRNEALLVKSGNLWFFPDRSVYVYYTPTHWRSAALANVTASKGDASNG